MPRTAKITFTEILFDDAHRFDDGMETAEGRVEFLYEPDGAAPIALRARLHVASDGEERELGPPMFADGQPYAGPWHHRAFCDAVDRLVMERTTLMKPGTGWMIKGGGGLVFGDPKFSVTIDLPL